jgi:hypothetical protein
VARETEPLIASNAIRALNSALWIRLLFFMSLLGFPAQSILLFLTIPLAPFPRATSLAPGGFLAAVEFAEVEDLALKHASAGDPAVFDHTPVEVLFAILAASLAAEEHAQ